MKCDMCGEEGYSVDQGTVTLVKGFDSYFICDDCLVKYGDKTIEEIVQMIKEKNNDK